MINKNGCACRSSPDRTELQRCVWTYAIPFVQYDPHSCPSHNTHPYLTQVYQSPSRRWSVPWSASMVQGVRALLEHHSSPALWPSSSALQALTPERLRNHFQKTFRSNHSRCRCPAIATASPLCVRQQQPTTAVVHERG